MCTWGIWIWEKCTLTIVLRGIPHVLIDNTDRVKSPLASSLLFAGSVYRCIMILRFLIKLFGMFPVQKSFVIEAFTDSQDHFWLFRHCSHDLIEQELFGIVTREIEVYKTRFMLVLIDMHRSVNTFVKHGFPVHLVRIYRLLWDVICIYWMILYLCLRLLLNDNQAFLRTALCYVSTSDVKTVDTCLPLIHYGWRYPDCQLPVILVFPIKSARWLIQRALKLSVLLVLLLLL